MKKNVKHHQDVFYYGSGVITKIQYMNADLVFNFFPSQITSLQCCWKSFWNKPIMFHKEYLPIRFHLTLRKDQCIFIVIDQ